MAVAVVLIVLALVNMALLWNIKTTGNSTHVNTNSHLSEIKESLQQSNQINKALREIIYELRPPNPGPRR